MSVIVVALCLATLAVTLYALHKVRRVHLMLYHIRTEGAQERRNLYQQVQALIMLNNDSPLSVRTPFMRGWAASPDVLTVLLKYMKENRPATVVECGSGVSTALLARCAEELETGHIYSLEHEPEYAEVQRNLIAAEGLADRVTIVDAPLTTHQIGGKDWTWYDIDKLPDQTIDLLFVDGPPETTGALARYPAGPLLGSRVSHGVIVLDDTVREDEKECARRWARELAPVTLVEERCEKGCIVLKRGL